MNHSCVVITCNSADCIETNLRNHAAHFDRVVVCDGPSLPGKRETVGNGLRLTGGKNHSTDGTQEIVRKVIRDFPHVTLLTRNNPWPGKVSKFNAALEFLKPGYVWQIDCDEFYHGKDIQKLKGFLDSHPYYTDVEFWARNFWGSVKHYTSMKPGAWGNSPPWRRVFKYDHRDRFKTHEPPRMFRQVPERLLTRMQTYQMGIFMHHYGYVKSSQFRARELFYGLSNGQLVNSLLEWRKEKPLASSAGELCIFLGKHPIDTGIFNE